MEIGISLTLPLIVIKPRFNIILLESALTSFVCIHIGGEICDTGIVFSMTEPGVEGCGVIGLDTFEPGVEGCGVIKLLPQTTEFDLLSCKIVDDAIFLLQLLYL